MSGLAILMIMLWTSAAMVSAAETGGVVQSDQSVPAETGPGERIAAECRTGSLIFSRGDCLAVRAYTASPYTHVATVVYCDGEPVVYDSMNGVGVRKTPLEEYLETQAPDEVHLFHPRREFTDDETRQFVEHLERQLGRPYSVKHHVTGKRCQGVHCSEYVTDALVSIDWLRADNPVKVSPASLLVGITHEGIYSAGETLTLTRVLEPIPEPQSPCGRWWQETKQCTLGSCRQLSRWFLCR